jgi:hypothetical protein
VTPQRTPAGKWRIYDRATGQPLDRWPVDARGMLERGDYVAEPPEGVEAPVVTPEQRGIVERPNPTVPGLEAERKSRADAAKAPSEPVPATPVPDVPPADPNLKTVKAEDAGPAEPLQPPKRRGRPKKK